MKRTTQLFAILGILLVRGSLYAQSSGPEVMMDNPDATYEGDWVVSTYTGDRIGNDYRFSSTTEAAKPTATATYRPKIPKDGNYHVDIYYSQGGNRSAKAKWIVSYAGNEETIFVNQQKGGGQWTRLVEDKPFKAGKDGFVRLQNDTGLGGFIVVSDAVRFVPVGTTPGSGPSGSKASVPSGLAMSVSAENGTVTRSPEQPTYPTGATVTLTAKPNAGYLFAGWSGDATGFRNPLSVTMSSSKTIRANFVSGTFGEIIDNTDVPEVSYEGSWLEPSQTWPGARYENYRFASSKAKADAKAIYRPNLLKAGKYDLYVWHTQGANRTKSAPWTVVYKGGQTTTNINQSIEGGKWVRLAAGLPFDAGKNGYAQLSNNPSDAGPGVVVIADAVAFVYMGP
jgi:hypothetical protein